MIYNLPIIDKHRSFALLVTFLVAFLFSGCATSRSVHAPVTLLEDFVSGSSETDNQSRVLSLARSLLGTPYRYGGMSPSSGFDCSGYLSYVFQNAVGISLPRMAKEQSKAGRAVTSSLQPADLVFFKISKSDNWHTGIYIKEGKFIHAPSLHGAVHIEDITLPYWKKRFRGARRLL
ncbi:MAG: C40 family peptidase [Nitrospirota bacterium]